MSNQDFVVHSFFHVLLKAVNMSVCNPQGYQLRQIVAEMLYPADWEPTRRMNSGQGPRMSDLTSWAMQNTALWFAFINIIQLTLNQIQIRFDKLGKAEYVFLQLMACVDQCYSVNIESKSSFCNEQREKPRVSKDIQL